MEAASEDFCKFLAISGKQSGTEWEKPSDAVASDVLVEGDDVHPREVDPAFLCLTDDQKASSALCTDLYEEVTYINIILLRV